MTEIRATQMKNVFATSEPRPPFLPVRVYSSPGHISLLKSCHPSPGGHGRNTSASFETTKVTSFDRGQSAKCLPRISLFSEPSVCFFPILPCLSNHPRGDWAQNSFHHGQMLPVVVRLKVKRVTHKGSDKKGHHQFQP